MGKVKDSNYDGNCRSRHFRCGNWKISNRLMCVAQSVHFVVSFFKIITVLTTLWNSKKGYTSSSWNFQLHCIISSPLAGALKPPNQLPAKVRSGAVSPVVKRLENETDRLFPPSAEIKNAWSYPITSPYVVMLWCLTELKVTERVLFGAGSHEVKRERNFLIQGRSVCRN